MDKKRYGNILLVLLILVTLFSGCTQKTEDKIFCCGYPQEPYGDALALIFPEYRVESQRTTIFYYVKEARACEAFDIQAEGALEKGFASCWYPHYLATVVIAVDRDQTDIVVTGWEDVFQSKEKVGYFNSPSGRYLFAAMSLGMGEDDYLSSRVLKQMREMRINGILQTDDVNAPILICFDHHAAALASRGRNLEIIVPREGTITFERGLMSKGSLLLPADTDEKLLAAGLRLTDGRTQNPLYPDERAYMSARRITDSHQFWEQTKKYDESYRRTVMGTHLYRSAHGYEHNMFPIFMMVLIIVFLGIVIRSIDDSYIRRIMFVSGCALIGWVMLRYVKYQLWLGDVGERYMWYGYYIFMLALPMCLLLLSFSLDDPRERSSRRKSEGILLGIYVFMVLSVFTNDLHNWVFVVDLEDPNWNANYKYGWLYYVVIGISLLSILFSMAVLIGKAWKNKKWKSLIFPLLFYILLFGYTAGYVTGMPLAADTDITLTMVGFYLLYLFAIVMTGLIPLNRKYKDLFSHSHLRMQIVNEKGEVILHSADWSPPSEETWEQIQNSSGLAVQRDEYLLLYSEPIPGGFVLWQENIRELHILYNQICEFTGRIEATNGLLAKEKESKYAAAKREEKHHLMSMLEVEINSKIGELNRLIGALPGKEDKKTEIARITILLCYIKRRSDLLFRERETECFPSEDILFYMRELAEIAQLAGVHLTIHDQGEEMISSRQATLFYDFLYETLWACIYRGEARIIVQMILEESNVRMTLLLSGEYLGEDLTSPHLAGAISMESGRITLKELDDGAGIELSFLKGGEADV